MKIFKAVRNLCKNPVAALCERRKRVSFHENCGRSQTAATEKIAFAEISVCVALLLVSVGLLSACRSTAPKAPADLSELTQTSYLQMVMRYLYRWQLDESQFETLLDQKNIVFWVRPLELELDPGDRSQFADILLPQLNLSLRVKKANYRIAEIGTDVKSQHFKITGVTHGDVPSHRPSGCMVATLNSQEMRDFLFNTRWQLDTFDPAIVTNLLNAARDQAAKEGLADTNILNGQQLIDIAPLSPVANETWVLWEIRRKLFYIASDIDLADPAVWKYQTLTFRTFDLKEQVVVSHEEASGSNFYLTRHQISRVLFNCMVLGQRIDIPPNGPSNSAPTIPARIPGK
jgi:hypothetical protein